MKKNRNKTHILVLTLTMLTLGCFGPTDELSQAAIAPMDMSMQQGLSIRAVLVKQIGGGPEFRRQGTEDWIKLTEGLNLGESDVVRTDGESTAKLLFKGHSDTFANVRPNTVFELTTVTANKESDETEVSIMIGSVLLKANKLGDHSKFEVRTPTSIIGIRGTEFEVTVD